MYVGTQLKGRVVKLTLHVVDASCLAAQIVLSRLPDVETLGIPIVQSGYCSISFSPIVPTISLLNK